MNAVLLLIDFQNDFLDSPDLDPPRSEVIAKAASLLRTCRSSNIPVVHVRTRISEDQDQRMLHWKQKNIRKCLEGTPGYEGPDVLEASDGEAVFHKTAFSAFTIPEMESVLSSYSPDVLLIAGVHLHACIRATALDAYQRGFRVCIVEDAVASDDPVHAALTRQYLSGRSIEFRGCSTALKLNSINEQTERRSPSKPEFVFPCVAVASEAEIGNEVRRSLEAWKDWARVPVEERAESLRKAAMLLQNRETEWAQQIVLEVGKPLRYATAEIERSVALLTNVASYATAAQELECEPNAIVRYVPRGVIALITPWNNPVAIPVGKIAPALLYGNSVVWKPSPAASDIALQLRDLFHQAGVPTDALSVVHGERQTAEILMKDPGVEAVTLSGSLHAGYSAQAVCARRMIPFQGEFGGNNASIVWPDCHLRQAAELIAEGAFGFSGQRCTANRRAIVHSDCYEAFLELLEHSVSEMAAGDPYLYETRIGPLISLDARERVARAIPAASDDVRIFFPQPRMSAEVLLPAYHAPVLVCCNDPDHEVVQQETFGPILVIQKAASWSEAIRFANGVKQGLVASLFSKSDEIRKNFLSEAEAGILKLNRSTSDAGVNVPFGGWKRSGVGPPEHGPSNREFYTRTQAIYH